VTHLQLMNAPFFAGKIQCVAISGFGNKAQVIINPLLTVYRNISLSCKEVTKREAVVDISFSTKDTIYHAHLKMSVVPARSFKMMFPSADATEDDDQAYNDNNPNPYSCLETKDKDCNSALKDINFNDDGQGEWVTAQASLTPFKSPDCIGHFYRSCARATPHSLVLLHSGDLIGRAISRLTGRYIPFKRSLKLKEDYVDAWGIKMVDWNCTPVTLNFVNTEGLNFEVKARLHQGLNGDKGSTYMVNCIVVGAESGDTSYTSTGTFVLDPVH
jgi:hypothetical protein